MAEKYKLVVFPKAAEDMENIFKYISIELDNPHAAKNLINKFEIKLLRICEMPQSAPILANENIMEENLRKLVVDNYIIIYKEVIEKHEIHVIRVFYGMLNYYEVL